MHSIHICLYGNFKILQVNDDQWPAHSSEQFRSLKIHQKKSEPGQSHPPHHVHVLQQWEPHPAAPERPWRPAGAGRPSDHLPGRPCRLRHLPGCKPGSCLAGHRGHGAEVERLWLLWMLMKLCEGSVGVWTCLILFDGSSASWFNYLICILPVTARQIQKMHHQISTNLLSE